MQQLAGQPTDEKQDWVWGRLWALGARVAGAPRPYARGGDDGFLRAWHPARQALVNRRCNPRRVPPELTVGSATWEGAGRCLPP